MEDIEIFYTKQFLNKYDFMILFQKLTAYLITKVKRIPGHVTDFE